MKDMEDFYEGYWEHRKEIDHLYSDRVPGRLAKTVEILDNHKINTVLDVGCGEGTLGQILDEKYETVGVDISNEALQLANDHYDTTRQVNIEKEDLSSVVDTDFDAVVCLELLEHVFQPDGVLQNIRSVISEGGLLISSFPNFVFWEYRLDMLRGRPPQEYTLYSEAEHIQDFTMGTFEKLLDETGFAVEQWYPQYSTPKPIPSSFGRVRPALFANQIVVESKYK